MSLASSVSAVKSLPIDTPLSVKYTREGYVVFNEKGMVGKLCVENLNATLPQTEMDTVLQTAAASLCNLLTYGGMSSVEVRIDDEDDIDYVHMEDPLASEISFVRAPCPSKQVMYVRCAEIGIDFAVKFHLNIIIQFMLNVLNFFVYRMWYTSFKK